MMVPETIQEIHEVITIFIILLRYSFMVLTFVLECKSNDALAKIKAVAPNCAISYCICYLMIRGGTQGISAAHLSMMPDLRKTTGQRFE